MRRSVVRYVRSIATSRTIATSSSLPAHTSDVDIERTLALYPIFNLNNDLDQGTLGPRPGDEAILTLSGGVDSSVSAYLALVRGGLVPYKTLFMRNWNSLEESEDFEPGGGGGAMGCQWKQDWEKVLAMAKWLNVEAELIDLSTPYWNSVFSPALDEWSRGWTPNPDVTCNREIKFGELLKRMDEHGTSTSFGRRQTRRWLVTGHYAGLQYYLYPTSSCLHGRLYRASDPVKDQSYFLSSVSSEQLGRTHLPLANFMKMQVRQLARRLGMPTAESQESMGLCFVGERKGSAAKSKVMEEGTKTRIEKTASQPGFAGFLGDYIDSRHGDLVNTEGQVMGSHAGLHTLTIGQGARISGARVKHFVAAKDIEQNRVLVVPGSDHPALQCKSLEMASFIFINEQESRRHFSNGEQLLAQIRHRQDAVPCEAHVNGQSVKVTFTPPILAVAEGQVCALYRQDECLGSGVISAVRTKATSVEYE